jgi:hypothetical protein
MKIDSHRMTLLEKLTKAAERTLGASAVLSNSHTIIETFDDRLVWEGAVNEFRDDRGQIVYVWAVAVPGEKEPQYIGMLTEPPITTPLAAVRAWLATEARKK